jgi:Na+-transporting NADH:ubiquinone oxidoreductase subunit NqrB
MIYIIIPISANVKPNSITQRDNKYKKPSIYLSVSIILSKIGAIITTAPNRRTPKNLAEARESNPLCLLLFMVGPREHPNKQFSSNLKWHFCCTGYANPSTSKALESNQPAG